MHPRFARARRTRIECPGGAVDAAVAEGFRLRLSGLMGLEREEVEPLLFPRCRSIHTFGMKTPIDLVWLDGTDVLGVVEGLEPRRHARAPRCVGRRRDICALELAPGHAERFGFRR